MINSKIPRATKLMDKVMEVKCDRGVAGIRVKVKEVIIREEINLRIIKTDKPKPRVINKDFRLSMARGVRVIKEITFTNQDSIMREVIRGDRGSKDSIMAADSIKRRTEPIIVISATGIREEEAENKNKRDNRFHSIKVL